MYDIAIIGGGPAGANLARLIGKKYKVLLIEKRNFEAKKCSIQQKCCGGLIAPDAQRMLAKFGLGIPKSVLLSPQLFAVRTIDMDNSLERYYQRHYINIDREEFDQWLESIIPSEVEIINAGLYNSFEIEDGLIKIKFHYQQKDYQEKVKLLIGADGAFSKVRRQAFPKHPSPKLYIAIQEWFQTKQNLDYYGAIFDREISDFYSWTIPKEENLILGAALKPGGQAHEKFILLKKKLLNYGFEFTKSIKKNSAYLFRPISKNTICTGNQRIALIGEAAGFISPSSAEGLSYGFKSSLALAKALQNGIEGYHNLYRSNCSELLLNILAKNIKSPAMYNKYLRKIILLSGLRSIELELNDST